MYGQLQFDPGDTETPWAVHFFLRIDLDPPNLSPVQAAGRGNALKQLKTEVPDLTPAEIACLSAICRGLPLDRKDLVSDLFLGLAHLRLPVARRKEREGRIAATLDTYFLSMTLPPAMAVCMAYIKLMAPLTPDAFLNEVVCSQAARLQMVFGQVSPWDTCCFAHASHLEVVAASMGVVSRSDEDRLLFNTLFSRPWAERYGFIELVDNAARFKLLPAVSKTVAALRSAGLLVVSEGDILVNVLQDCQAAKLNGSMEEDMDTAVTNQVALGRTAELARTRAVLASTMDANRLGVNLGRRVNEQNTAAVIAAGQAFWLQLLRMTPERLQRQKERDKVPVTPGAAPTAPGDLDPVHAWSVSRLLRWIEGPILEKAPAPLERARFVLKEKAARQEARAKTRMPEKAVRADKDLSALDIDLAVQNALSTTAGFFIGDIDDMLFRAKALGAASPAAQHCLDLLAPLQKLKKEDRSDDQKARALLHTASLAVDQLRLDLRTVASDAQLRQHFDRQLSVALYNEPMVEGKRHGGVIQCRLKRSDWPWVAEQYHRRWLPWNQRITVDGVPRVLQPDQALGLYVTGKSLSGYEFDVSVHLWLRRAGRESAPGTSVLPLSPMNTEDWIDTLTPCAVLHVPSPT
ncbi:MAG: hypothetical protein Q8S92_20445 [Hydrogenophaga sp.]|uniref:hypothetical protein n=1 Tax=Hydrogenophaga sp. TaxID=1904254 RepID=UPI0027351003|nr:hypothetical protein [Hydrogenophaga sp.]MDP3351365.1 hypothetical protein [Hydrogenophaga sp.]